MTLIEQILATKGKYQGMKDAGGRLFPDVQNFGLKAGQRSSRHKVGSYHQFAVRAEEDIPPLLTHRRVAEAVRALEEGNETEAARELAAFTGPLYLNGLRELSTDVAHALAAHSGGKLSLDGLTRLSDEAAKALAGYSGILGLDGLESLSPAAYQVLKARSQGISMEGLDTLPEWEFDGEQWDWQGDEDRCPPHYVGLIELSLRSLKGSSPEVLQALDAFLDEMIALVAQGVPAFMERHEQVQVAAVVAQCRSSQIDPVAALLHTLLLLAESRPFSTRRVPDRRDALFALSVEYPELASALAAQVCAMPEGVLEQALEAWSQEPPDSRRKIHLTSVQNWLPRLRQDFPAALSSPAPASESSAPPCL